MSRMNYYYQHTYRILRYLKRGILVDVNRIKKKKRTYNLMEYGEDYCQIYKTNEFQNENAYYGVSKMLKDYSGYKGLITANVEHGVYLDNDSFEIEHYDLPCIITFGKNRLNDLVKMTDKPIFTIGPYILYKNSLYSGIAKELQKDLGKTALVFPTHGIENINVEYEFSSFVSFINEVKQKLGIQTVLVSLYFKDVKMYASRYESCGFKVVCSGHRNDIDFLDRQKAYLEMTNIVITNGVGTHIGYSVAMNRPISFFDQKVIKTAIDGSDDAKALEFCDKSIEEYNMRRIVNAFCGINEEISTEQRRIVDEYWGLSQFRTPEEILFILKSAESVFKMSEHSNKSYRELYLDYLKKCTDVNKKEIIYEGLGVNRESI